MAGAYRRGELSGMMILTDNEVNDRVSPLARFFDGLVRVRDGLFHVEAVEVDFAGFAILST